MRPLGANMLSTVLPNALAAWLLTEWLWPLEAVTDTAHIGVFVSFVALCFGLHLLRVPIWLSALGKMVYIWWALSRLFSFASIAALPHALWRDSTVWLSGDWSSMPGDALRTFVFFLLLWAVSFLLHWLIVRRNRWFVPYALTVGYIAVLDTFLPYSGNGAILRLVALGFFAFVWFQGEELQAKAPSFRIGKWRAAALFIPAVALAVGYAGPKLPPQWPDPVAFIRSYHAQPEETNDDSPSPGVAKVGYGQNDSRLGGPFIADDTVVFIAKDQGRHYWRVETKDIYTGKGWEAFQSEQVQSFGNGELIRYEWWSDKVKTVEQTAEITPPRPGVSSRLSARLATGANV
nr:transglutaminaseTgpA domain-containing protein [Geobacillus thermoleovorans]